MRASTTSPTIPAGRRSPLAGDRGATQINPETTAHLLRACFEARKRFYAQRGLPLHCLEFYAAATQSVRGSLTPAIQDRQIVSWLMESR